MLDFASRRLNHDFETCGRLASCGTVNESADVMREFYEKLWKDYADEANSLTGIASSIGEKINGAFNGTEAAAGSEGDPATSGTERRLGNPDGLGG